MLFDIHCHINSLEPEQIEQLVSNCNYYFIDTSIDFKTSLKSLELSQKYPFIYSSVGLHPFCAKEYNEHLPDKYEELILKNKKIVAVGEIGLDFKATDLVSLKTQEVIFKKFALLAKKLNLPVILHNRTKDFNILEVLDELFNSYDKIIFHCFSYDEKFMYRIIEKGGKISFSLNIFRKNKNIISSLLACPLENLFLETDSPYIFIEQKPSLPSDIKKVYELVAELKNIEIEKLKKIIFENVRKVFNIKLDEEGNYLKN